MKISYINQIANLCEDLGANVNDVVYGVGMDHRIGRAFLNAGLGYGGACFLKDTEALAYLARESGNSLSIVDAAIQANKKLSPIFLEKLLKYFNWYVQGKKIAISGLVFKPNTGDMREAPSLKVKVYDPIV